MDVHPSQAVLLSVVVVASALGGVAASAGGGTATQATAAPQANAGAQSNASAVVVDPYREIAVGDPLRRPYTVELSGTENVTFVMTGARNTNHTFWANVTVRDTDGDGVVKLHVNTWELGHEDTAFEATSGTVTRLSQPALPDGQLVWKTKSTDTSAYDIYVGAGRDPGAVLQEHSMTARLRVVEGETEGIDPMTAPAGAHFESLAEVYDEPGAYGDTVDGALSAEGDRKVAVNDTLLLAPWGGGFYGSAEYAIENANGSRDEALLWLIAMGYYEFEMVQNLSRSAAPTGGEPKTLDLQRALETDALTFRSGIDYYHLLFQLDTGARVFERGGEYVTASPGEVYQVRFQKARRLSADMDPAGTRSVFVNVTMLEPQVEVTPPSRSLAEGELAGRTTLAPGSVLTVVTNASDERYTAAVARAAGGDESGRAAGFETHPWNVSVPFGANGSAVGLAVWNDHHGRLGEYPDGTDADLPAPTTAAPTSTTRTPDGTTTDAGTSTAVASTTGSTDGTAVETTAAGVATSTTAGGGRGGPIPGFSAAVALVATLCASLAAGQFGSRAD